MLGDVGVVAIGRNEGERLRRCLESLAGRAAHAVYVDSGSTDGSRGVAAGFGVDVVELDLSTPFTAARARNEGWRRLLAARPGLRYVQFVDGDCEVAPGWLERARGELEADAGLAAACGRRRERFPEASIYNRLCDIEWDTPVGDARACGGDALVRAEALTGVGGYDPAVIAAEDDEFCLRLRRAGWRIRRIDAEMTVHDAAMTRAGQWWKRATRCGFAYALGAAMHGRGPERHFVRERRRVAVWGLALPVAAAAAAPLTAGASLALLGLYAVQWVKAYRATRGRVARRTHAAAYALSCVLAKFPEAAGLVKFHAGRLRRRPARIIEYK